MATREVSYNLAGSVRNQSLGVAGTTIVLYDYWSTGSGLTRHFVAEQCTGPKGEFSFDVRLGVYSIEVVPNRDTRFARQSIDTVRVTNNTTITINLKHGSTLTGKVCTESGDPVGLCEMLFFGIEPESLRASEPVSSNSSYSIALPKGKYYAACRQVIERTPSTSRAFLYPGMHVLDLYSDIKEDFVIPDMVLFKGVVTNSDGHPVSGVRATITSSSPSENQYESEAQLKAVVYSSKIGQFQCNVAPGTYDVKLEPTSDSHLSERLVSSILVDQARTRTYSLVAGYRLYGRVSFDGEPVENALVSVYGGKIDSSAVTDENGIYSFSLSGGTYELSVMAQPDSLAHLPFRLLAPTACSVKLAEDTCLDVQLEHGVSLSGKVVDKSGSPRPSVQLSLYADKGAEPDTTNDKERPLTFGITSDDGSFEFRVSPGKYWLIMNNQQSTAMLIEAAGEDLQSDLTWGTGCLVRFEIFSEADEPIANCRIVCEPYSGTGAADSEPMVAVSADDGSCGLAIPTGIYSFRIEPPEHGSFQSRTIRQFSINSDVKRRIKLPLKAAAVES